MKADFLTAAASALTLMGCASSAPRVAARSDAQHLVDLSQSLLSAVTAGDKSVFAATLAEDGVFVDEEATVRSRAELIEQIGPLPAGYQGRLEMRNARTRVHGDIGVVTFDIIETLDLYGQRLITRYHTTDTYQRERGAWLLVAEQTGVLPSELLPAAANPARYDEYVGTYALAPDVRAAVVREGEHLYMQREGRAPEELLPIGGDRFIRSGHPRGERYFRRDSGGLVDALVDRRDNNDLVWRRVHAQ